MKKNYFFTLFAALMLSVAMPAAAQVTNMAELYGKYKFTATITPNTEGEKFTDTWKSECEVIITADDNVERGAIGVIKGLLGAQQEQVITDIDAKKFCVNNPNPNWALLDGSKFIGVTDFTLENIEMYTMEYYYNAETKDITIPDFSICQFSWPGNTMVANELAKVTNAKLTLIESYAPSTSKEQWVGTYNVKATLDKEYIEGYDYPTEFEMEVVYNEDAQKYFVTKFLGRDVADLNYGGLELVPSATDPNKAEIMVGYFLQEITRGAEYLCLRDYYNTDANTPIPFTLLEDGTYTLGAFTVTDMTYNTDDYSQIHTLAAYYGSATATKDNATEEETTPFTWPGTYTVTAGSITPYNTDYTYPETFEMEIIYDEAYNEYLITKFFGQDVESLNYGGILLVPSTSNPNEAEMYTGKYLQTIKEGTYLMLHDMNLTASSLILTADAEGKISFSDFCVSLQDGGETSAAALYSNVTAVKNEDNAVENIFVKDNAVVGIFDLLGRKLDAITTPGLYIVNGKKVVVK